MFQYEYEKRPPSRTGPEWSRVHPSSSERCHPAIRPLPPRPSSIIVPEKTTVPLRVWIIASASCFAVCAALVLATVVITKWGTATDNYTTRELFEQEGFHQPQYPNFNQPEPIIDNDELPIYEKLSIFKNLVSNHKNSQNNEQNRHKNLLAKPQLHPLHDEVLHQERNIKKKDKVVHENSDLPLVLPDQEVVENNLESQRAIKTQLIDDTNNEIPSFRPILPQFSNNLNLDLPYEFDGKQTPLIRAIGTINKIHVKVDVFSYASAKEEYFYNDDNLYDDYMQSNSMTSYLIEKVQELHDWVTTDPDFAINTTNRSDFKSLLKALNDSIVEGNVTIVMSKLKDLYFGDNYTNANYSRKVIVANSTDMLSFGILTLDVMLLHNIQLMAWESQEAMRNKMLKDPDVFAFNALFLDPAKVETKQNEVEHDSSLFLKRLNPRQEAIDDLDIGKNLLENILEVGMSTARAAIHLGRAYKNTKNLLTQISSSNKEAQSTNPISRNIDANTHALNHLQTSFDNHNAANVQTNGSFFTELDCVWILYCRNLVATTKLNSPYSTMARINGVALRMLTGELPSNKALDTMLFEALTGWTDLKCNDMFPRCSKANAAAIVMDSILQSHRKSLSTNRGR